MAESADALDSGSSGSNTVCVQVTLSAPTGTPASMPSLVVKGGLFYCTITYKFFLTNTQMYNIINAAHNAEYLSMIDRAQ